MERNDYLEESVTEAIGRVFGRKVASSRIAARMTQGMFADTVGFHRTYLHKIESGGSNPSFALAYAIARTLGVPTADLVPTDDEIERALSEPTRSVASDGGRVPPVVVHGMANGLIGTTTKGAGDDARGMGSMIRAAFGEIVGERYLGKRRGRPAEPDFPTSSISLKVTSTDVVSLTAGDLKARTIIVASVADGVVSEVRTMDTNDVVAALSVRMKRGLQAGNRVLFYKRRWPEGVAPDVRPLPRHDGPYDMKFAVTAHDTSRPSPAVVARATSRLCAKMRFFLRREGLSLCQYTDETSEGAALVTMVAPGRRRATAFATYSNGDLPWSVRFDEYVQERFDDGWVGAHVGSSIRHGPYREDDIESVATALAGAYADADVRFVPKGDRIVDGPHVIAAGLALRDLGAEGIRGVDGRTDALTADFGGRPVTVTAHEFGVRVESPSGVSDVDMHGSAVEYAELVAVLTSVRDGGSPSCPGPS